MRILLKILPKLHYLSMAYGVICCCYLTLLVTISAAQQHQPLPSPNVQPSIHHPKNGLLSPIFQTAPTTPEQPFLSSSHHPSSEESNTVPSTSSNRPSLVSPRGSQEFISSSNREQQNAIKDSLDVILSNFMQRQQSMMNSWEEKVKKMIDSSLQQAEERITARLTRLEEKMQHSLEGYSVSWNSFSKGLEEQHFLSQQMVQINKDMSERLTHTSVEIGRSFDFLNRNMLVPVETLVRRQGSFLDKLDYLGSEVRTLANKDDSERKINHALSLLTSIDKRMENLRNLITRRQPENGNSLSEASSRIIGESEVNNPIEFTSTVPIGHSPDASFLKDKIEKVETDIGNYTRKVVNNISDLWREVHLLSNVTKESIQSTRSSLVNISRELQVINITLSEDIPSLIVGEFQELGTKINQLSREMTERHEILILNQASFRESCKRIQQEEGQVYDDFDLRLELMNETLTKISDNQMNSLFQKEREVHQRVSGLQETLEKFVLWVKRRLETDSPNMPLMSTTHNER